jgi:hypothetical protein
MRYDALKPLCPASAAVFDLSNAAAAILSTISRKEELCLEVLGVTSIYGLPFLSHKCC